MKITTWLALLALPAINSAAAEFAVPQGGAKLPTIAIVSCLADDFTRAEGAYCRTTYECSPRDGSHVSGTLWEGLRYHNSRRVTLESDAFAHQRSCVLDIEDAAQVQFFTGYRPAGFTGDVVAMVRSGSGAATNAVGDPVTVYAENIIGQFLSHSMVRSATLEEWCKERGDCWDWDNGTFDSEATSNILYLETVSATDKTECYVDRSVQSNLWRSSPWIWLNNLHQAWYHQQRERDCGDL